MRKLVVNYSIRRRCRMIVVALWNFVVVKSAKTWRFVVVSLDVIIYVLLTTGRVAMTGRDVAAAGELLNANGHPLRKT